MKTFTFSSQSQILIISFVSVWTKPLSKKVTMPTAVTEQISGNHNMSTDLTDPMIVNNMSQVKSNGCNLSDFASSYAGALRLHLKIPIREKSNKCSHCYYASSRASDLRTHIKTHTGEKSNKCNLCHYASSQAGDLKRHMKIHTGEKSNKCYLCH